MWLLAISIFAALKLLTWAIADKTDIPIWRQIAYLVAWPGMNAREFFESDQVVRVSPQEWLAALGKTLLGVIVIWAVLPIVSLSPIEIPGWTLLAGLALVLHCGFFHLLSCFWRSQGVRADPLMNRPLCATSVSEFWSRRWNTAYRDLTNQFVVRPLIRKIGAPSSLWLGFLVSGVIHDVVISVPAGAGYGLPTIFFLLQAAGWSLERSAIGKRIGLGRGLLGWCFTTLVLVLPAPLLFHRAFLENVLLPFCQAMTGLGARS